MKKVRCRDFFAWCLSFCFASLAMTAAAQSQAPGPNPNTNALVAISPDAPVQPQPGVQPQPAGDHWADYFRIQKVSKDDDWTRHFRIGAFVGMNISADFSMKGNFNISSAGSEVYEDGYVHPSGNAFGTTTDWGYDKVSQINGSKLLMHQAASFSPTSGSSSEKSGSVFPGFDMAYGGNLFYLGRARIGWDLGFGLLPISITDNRPMSASVNQNTYSFDTGGISMPDPGYPGSSTASGPAIYSERKLESSVPILNVPVTGSRTLDVMLYTVRLGPSVYWDVNEYIGVSASAGPAIGIVSGNYKYDETVLSTPNTGRFGTTDLVYGGYVNATVMYHVPDENADIYVGAQFMPMGDATFSGGGREARLKLGGQIYISAGVNWSF
jgi:hypothetical protein